MEWVGNTSYNGITIAAGVVEPVKTPVGILATRSVETKDGWLGQVIVEKAIVWQSEPFIANKDYGVAPDVLAVRAANDRVTNALRSLFA